MLTILIWQDKFYWVYLKNMKICRLFLPIEG